MGSRWRPERRCAGDGCLTPACGPWEHERLTRGVRCRGLDGPLSLAHRPIPPTVNRRLADGPPATVMNRGQRRADDAIQPCLKMANTVLAAQFWYRRRRGAFSSLNHRLGSHRKASASETRPGRLAGESFIDWPDPDCRGHLQ